MAKKVIKYAIITVCSVILFITVNQASNAERSIASVGGEVFFLILPLMWWIVGRMAKDFIREHKRIWHKIKHKKRDNKNN